MVDFAFDTTGVHRPDTRATVQDGRGSGALQTTGAMQDGRLRRPFVSGQYFDRTLWSILETERLQAKAVWGPKVH